MDKKTLVAFVVLSFATVIAFHVVMSVNGESDHVLGKNSSFQDGGQANASGVGNYIMTTAYTYSWIDATVGTRSTLSGDDAYQVVSLPFSFAFYGTNYSTLYICTNGFVSFAASSSYSNMDFPMSSPTLMIAPFWDDLRAESPSNIYYRSLTAPNRFVVEYLNYYSLGGTLVGTFEVVLFSNGDIVFNYDYVSSVTGQTVGLNYGIDTAYYNQYTGLFAGMNDFSIRFQTTSTPNTPPTLTSGSVSPSSGNQATTFTYTVTYTDADNNAPSYVRVYIDGSYYTMSKQNSGDVTYTDGCVYVYNLTLAPAPHSYSFGASDRFATISTNTVFGPNVAPPETSISWSVSPAIGDANTRFTFTFLYNYSVNPPSEVMVHVAGVGYQMSKLYPGDAIYTDGCVYECSMTIPAGLHEYYFFSQTPDGINFTSGPGRLLVMESSIDGELPVSIPPVMLLLVICVFATFSTVSLVKRIKSKKYIAQPNMPDLTIPTSAYLQSTYSSLDDVPEPIRARLARPVILESTPVPSPARAGQAQNQAIPAIPGSLKWTRMARYRILPDNVGDSRAIGDTGRSRVAGDSTGAFTTPCKLTRPGSAPAAVLVVKRSLRESMVSRSVSMNGHGSITCPTCMERIPAKISSGNDAPSCPLCLTSLPFEITCHACTATTTITRDELQTKDAMSLRCPVCMEPFTR